MNLPVIISKIGPALKGLAGKTLIAGQKHAPEICIGLGIVGFAGTVAATVHATNETRDILEEREQLINVCKKNYGNDEEHYTRKEYEADLKKIRGRTRRKLMRAWWPVGTLGAGSVISVLGGYKILNGRYVATAAAYKTLEAGYERYRENVIAKFGSDVDKEMMDIRAEEIEKELKRREEAQKAEDEAGKKRKKRKALPQGSDVVIFDEDSERWRRYWQADQVLDYLMMKESECEDRRRMNGHIFENEVLDILGLERTCEGQVLGWIDKPVSFNLFGNTETEVNRRRNILAATRNCEIHVPIMLEPEGIIFDKIEKKR